MKFYGKVDEYLLIEDALAAADMAWWLMELPSGAIFFSPKKITMLGYEAKDIDKFFHYKSFTDLVHPDDYAQLMKAMQDHLEGTKDSYIARYRIRNKDGNYVTFQDKGKIVGKKDDGSLAVVGIVTLVTENE
ncbi:MAG: PAS domain-containing protein [Candidatus Saccharibacteria bacterium]